MLTIIKANKNDLQKIIEMKKLLLEHQNKINLNNYKTPESVENTIKQYFNKSYSIFYIAKIDEKTAGFIHGTLDQKPQGEIQAYIQSLFAYSNYRNQGVGTALLKKLKEYFKEKNVIAGLTTDLANKNTIDFYLKRGFDIYKEEKDVVYLKQKDYI